MDAEGTRRHKMYCRSSWWAVKIDIFFLFRRACNLRDCRIPELFGAGWRDVGEGMFTTTVALPLIPHRQASRMMGAFQLCGEKVRRGRERKRVGFRSKEDGGEEVVSKAFLIDL